MEPQNNTRKPDKASIDALSEEAIIVALLYDSLPAQERGPIETAIMQASQSATQQGGTSHA